MASSKEVSGISKQLRGLARMISGGPEKYTASAPAAKPVTPSTNGVPSIAAYESYGLHCFSGAVADKYLKKQKSSVKVMSDHTWTDHSADIVAAAVLDWAVENGANTFCHWFQPMGAGGVRHGLTGQVQHKMMEFDRKDGKIKFDFNGKDLIRGETDGSSFPNGGMRATHTAGGYLAIDTSSPIFLRGDVIYVPAIFVSYHGNALDEKTPLLRSNKALSTQGTRLLNLLGYKGCKGLVANIGLEQEFFFVPRDAYVERLDLQMCGRTVMGQNAPRGQEMCDHYMAPPSQAHPALACMQEIQDQCWKIGIPLKTRHREVAPNQYEFAPVFGVNSVQIDQNLMVMQIIEEVSCKHGLAALLQEKPFTDINGSGKHNNWSIGTLDGINLFNPKQLTEASGSDDAFALVMTAIIAAIDEHGDTLRLAITCPGNEFRLGACEAPPSIISTYLGEDLTSYLTGVKEGKIGKYKPGVKTLDLGVDSVRPFQVPAEDRNRTSPFPYGGHRFEFRAVGSSQNVSLVNTCLNTITADKFREFADAIEGGAKPAAVAAAALKKNWKAIFNGDNYDLNNQAMLTDRGNWRIDSGVEAISVFTAQKNLDLFSRNNVFQPDECYARETIMMDHYTGTIEMEVSSMIQMIEKNVIPSIKAAGVGPLKEVESGLVELKQGLAGIHHAETPIEKANLARTLRLETMVSARESCDLAESVCPSALWTIATYKDLLFLDQNEI